MEIIETTGTVMPMECPPDTHIALQTRRRRGRIWTTIDIYAEDRIQIALMDWALTAGPARVVRVYEASGTEQPLRQHG